MLCRIFKFNSKEYKKAKQFKIPVEPGSGSRTRKGIKSPRSNPDIAPIKPYSTTKTVKKDEKPMEEHGKEIKNEVISQDEKKGFEKGYDKGKKKGFQLAQQESAPLVKQLGQSIRNLQLLMEYLTDQWENRIIDLAVDIAKIIVLDEISVDKKKFLPIIKTAVMQISGSDPIKIHLHPSIYQEIIKDKDLKSAIYGENKKIELVEDSTLTPGGCMVKSRIGDVDASIDTQIETIREEMIQVRNEEMNAKTG